MHHLAEDGLIQGQIGHDALEAGMLVAALPKLAQLSGWRKA